MDAYSIPATSGIYRIVNTVNGKLYIGSAVNLRRRWNQHCNTLQRNEHHSITLQHAWNKYGPDAFLFEVIEFVLSPFLLVQEQYWLDKLKPHGNRGYNINLIANSRLGVKSSPETCERLSLSHLGNKQSEEAKRKIAEARTGKIYDAKTREKIRLVTLGHPVSVEAREKLRLAKLGKHNSAQSNEKQSLAQIGRIQSPKTRAKIGAANKGRKVPPDSYKFRMRTLIITAPDGMEYTVTGLSKFCKEHGLVSSNLLNVARGRFKQTKGYKARFPETDAS